MSGAQAGRRTATWVLALGWVLLLGTASTPSLAWTATTASATTVTGALEADRTATSTIHRAALLLPAGHNAADARHGERDPVPAPFGPSGQLLLSLDGVQFTSTVDRPLFLGRPRLAPGGSVRAPLWVRNSSPDQAELDVAVARAPDSSDGDLRIAVTPAAGVLDMFPGGTATTSRSVAALEPGTMLLDGIEMSPRTTRALVVEISLPVWSANQGGSTAGLVLRVGLAEIGRPVPVQPRQSVPRDQPYPVTQGGATQPTGTDGWAAGPIDRGGLPNTGFDPSGPLITGATLIAAGVGLLLAHRRDRRRRS